MAQPVSDELLAALDGFSGSLVRPADAGYEQAR